MRFIGIIPARYASTRFPGKPLEMLAGKTIIERVYNKVQDVLDEVYVATDDCRIFNAVTEFGGKAIMTSSKHPSGTDRVYEAAIKILNATNEETNNVVIINIQGDEPFIQRSQIETVCNCFNDDTTQIATLAKPITDSNVIFNPNSPKVVIDNNGFAMYFSRNPIPYNRNCEQVFWKEQAQSIGLSYNKHIGLYAYRLNVLSEITNLPQSTLELVEKLEQLRWLQNGYKIKVGLTNVETIGIDTPDDLIKAEEYFKTYTEDK